MPNTARPYLNPSSAPLFRANTAPREQLKKEFGRRLQNAMLAKGWNQSELARQAAKFVSDKNFPRDNVSNYIRGRTFPQSHHIDALCKALGAKREDLIPAEVYASVDDGPRPMEFRDTGNGRGYLTVDTEVSMEVAIQVMQLLHKDRAQRVGLLEAEPRASYARLQDRK
jgi:transcriptional regulator with XRE-family HTH domain